MAGPRERSTGNDIQAVVRAADILTLLTLGNRSTTVAEASRALGVERTTMHRYFNTLEQVGLVEREANAQRGRFVLGPLAQQICTAVVADSTVRNVASARLQPIADRTRATAVLCLWGRNRAVVAHVAYPTTEPVAIRVAPGQQLELSNAQSQLFLALRPDQDAMQSLIRSASPSSRTSLAGDVERVAAERFAEQTFSQAVRGIATPIFQGQQICATLGLVSTTDLLPGGKDSPKARLLRAAADEVSVIVSNSSSGVYGGWPSNP